MSATSITLSKLKTYEILGCAVFDKNLISLWGQEPGDDDPLETKPTAVFFYYNDEPKDDQWAYSEVGSSTGITGCAAYLPKRQWVYVLDDGEVYVVGKGYDDFEKKILPEGRQYFSKVKTINLGNAVAVGPHNKIYIREEENIWKSIGPAFSDKNAISFSDIDGVSLDNLYACAGKDGIWHYSKKKWGKVDTGTNKLMEKVCCGNDGSVYITTSEREIIWGSGTSWKTVKQTITTERFESIVNFSGRILISTETEIYEICNGEFMLAKLPDMPNIHNKSHLAASSDVLVIAGTHEAVMFDGSTWTKIL